MCILNPDKSSQLDIKLWFLPHISTDAIQTAIDAKALSVLYQLNWVPRATDVRDKNAGLKCGASVSLKIGPWHEVSWRHGMDKTSMTRTDWLLFCLYWRWTCYT